jgi:excinuclease ABC subunit B
VGDTVEQLSIINPISGETLVKQDQFFIYPAKHFVMPEERIAAAIETIKGAGRALQIMRETGKLLEAQRLNARTRFDIEMLQRSAIAPASKT